MHEKHITLSSLVSPTVQDRLVGQLEDALRRCSLNCSSSLLESSVRCVSVQHQNACHVLPRYVIRVRHWTGKTQGVSLSAASELNQLTVPKNLSLVESQWALKLVIVPWPSEWPQMQYAKDKDRCPSKALGWDDWRYGRHRLSLAVPALAHGFWLLRPRGRSLATLWPFFGHSLRIWSLKSELWSPNEPKVTQSDKESSETFRNRSIMQCLIPQYIWYSYDMPKIKASNFTRAP